MISHGEQRLDSSIGYELARLAIQTASGRDPAENILRLLSSIDPADSAMLIDSSSGKPRVAAAFGYPADVLKYVVSDAYYSDDPAYRSLVSDTNRSFCRHWGDVGADYSESATAQRYLLPFGYKNGVTARLVTSDGRRHVGEFHMNTFDARTPSGLLTALQHAGPIVADIGETAGINSRRSEPRALLLLRPHGTVRVMSRDDAPDLAEVVEQAVAYIVRTHSYLPDRAISGLWQGPSLRWCRLEAERTRSGVLIGVTPLMQPLPLTGRELQIVTACAAGLTNRAIARRLVLSERTVAHRLESIYTKLGVGSRAAAVTTCIDLNLRLFEGQVERPPEFITPGPPYSSASSPGDW